MDPLRRQKTHKGNPLTLQASLSRLTSLPQKHNIFLASVLSTSQTTLLCPRWVPKCWSPVMLTSSLAWSCRRCGWSSTTGCQRQVFKKWCPNCKRGILNWFFSLNTGSSTIQKRLVPLLASRNRFRAVSSMKYASYSMNRWVERKKETAFLVSRWKIRTRAIQSWPN